MAVLTTDDLEVIARGDGRVLLRAPIGGRRRDLIMEAEAAQRVGTVLANAGFDALGRDPGFPQVARVRLKPYDDSGCALLEFTLERGHGPLLLRISAEQITALAQIAQAALEFSKPAGEA